MSALSHSSRTFLTTLLAGASLLAISTAAWADIAASTTPTGGTVTAGNATISQQGSTVTVNQTSQRAILGWQTFDVGSGAAVHFVQPDNAAVALNRVLSGAPSTINGSVTANGQVFLINPAGIVFGAGAAVNVGGLVASTMDINDNDFMAGKNSFQRNGSSGSIVNQGSITATPGGMVAFLAPELRNEGVITAQLGTVVMAAGEQVVLNIDAAGGVTVQVDPATIKTMIDNRSMVVAQNGAVILSAKAADALIGSVINNSGVIEASSLTSKGGSIELSGATSISNSGTLDASGVNGGKILIAADPSTGLADIGGKISVAGSNGTGGTATITGNQALIDQGAHIDATGTSGGGTINVGGSWEGQDATIANSTGVAVAPTAILDASATVNGNGGSVVVRSDVTNVNSVTRAYGAFLAEGGVQGGNGGRIETSGYWLDTAGSTGSAAARGAGTAGLWLFDPYNVTITSSDSAGSFSGNSPATWTASGSGSTINTADITTYLNGGTNVLISTTGAGGDNGDITVNSAIQKTAGNGNVTLTLSATNNVVVNAAINNSGGSGKLNVNLDADSDANGAGIIYLNGDISTGGGYLAFGTGATASINSVSTMVGGDVYVTGAGARSITTGGGAVTVNGQMILTDTSGFNITTAGGSVTFTGLIDSGDSYTLVSAPGTNWTTDFAAAQSGTGGNIGDTYLATVTSRLESQVVATTSYSGGSYQAVWLGARRVTGIGSDAVWRWVAGPEGLTNGGQGLPFFTQSPLGGGTPINGAYNNWNGGGNIGTSEPNNAGGGTNLGVESESVLQTLGATGLWNDLSKTSSTLNYYVMETNLANSPLTVNAGSGTVTFGGAVGSNKQLSALTVTGIIINVNGGSVATTTSQTYNGQVDLGASATAFTVSAGNFITVASYGFDNSTNNPETMSVTASGDVELSVGSAIDGGPYSLGVTLTSQGGTVKFDASSIIYSQGGAIKIVSNALSVDPTAVVEGEGNGSLQIMPYTAGTTMGLGTGASGSLNLGNALFSTNFINNLFGSVILGGNNTGLVTVGNTFTLERHNTTIESDTNIAFASNANVTANGFLGLQLDNAGTASENNASVINASALSLSGTGATFTLNNGTNTASTFAATAGTVNYVNQGGLVVGVTGVTNGVVATGNVTLQTVGTTADLTLNKVVSSSGGNVVLAAARNFINNNASNTGLVASGGGKHYYVYSTDPSATTEGMTGYSKHYNQTYSAGSTPAYASSGNWFFYSVAPVLNVTLASAGITYGMADPALASNYTGFIDSDNASTAGISGSASTAIAAYTASGAGYRPAGTYATSITSVAGLASSQGYSFTTGSGNMLTVSPKNITISSFSAADKLFDGTTTATITGIGGVNGVLAGDVYGFSPDGATFDTSLSGIGKTVTVSGITLNGADAGNYHVATTGLTTLATIRPSTIFVPPANTTVVAPTVTNVAAVQTQPLPPQQQVQAVPMITASNLAIIIPHSNSGSGIGQGIVITEIHAGNGGGILATVGEQSGGFSFTVSPKLGRGLDHATLEDNATLPAWLNYDPASRTFSAANVPPGGLPLVVVLNNPRNGKHVEVTISE